MNFSEIMYYFGVFMFVFSITTVYLLTRQKIITNNNIIDAIFYSTVAIVIAIIMTVYIKK
jgi:hypothetical protein